jgi:ABC-2 type transport system ATP-binding protein
MLQANKLSKKYGNQIALDSLDLSIAAGEIFCLLGANGAGKTTTINLFLNFTTPTSGQALIDGLDVTVQPFESKRRLAYIPETVMLYRNLSGVENLDYFASLGTGRSYTRVELEAFLRRAGLAPEAASKRIGSYSKGMRQKVGIAIAIAKQAKVLLLDEPTSGLDPAASNEFSDLLTQLAGEGVAVLMATHDLFRAKECGTRVGIMKQGRLVQTMMTSAIGHTELESIYLEHMRN